MVDEAVGSVWHTAINGWQHGAAMTVFAKAVDESVGTRVRPRARLLPVVEFEHDQENVFGHRESIGVSQ